MLVRPGNPDFLDLPVARAARRMGERPPRRGHARHPPPRRALRRLRRCDLRAQGVAAANRAPRVPHAAGARRRRRAGGRGGGRRHARRRGGRRRAGGRPDHAPPRLLAARTAASSAAPASPICATACSTRSPSCSCASTWRDSSGATARSRTRSSGATPARSRPISWMPRRARCTRELSDGQRAHDLQIAEENVGGRAARPRGRRAGTGPRGSIRSRRRPRCRGATRRCGRS